MQPEVVDVAKWLAGILVLVLGWFLRHAHAQIEVGLASKADKEAMSREIESLRMELKDSRETRERELERLERMYDGKITAMAGELRSRMDSMEKNVDAKLDMLMEMIRGGKRP